jgi:hypothetical protein
MQKKLTVALALAIGVLTACERNTTAPNALLDGRGVNAPLAAVTSNTTVPFSDLVFVPCANGGAGEFVQITGDVHELLITTTNNGGGVHVKFHYQPQGLTGVGLVTGDTYRATGVTQGETNVAAGTETTFINNFRLIGPGPGNNLLIHETVHLTVNANGDVTATHDNLSVECK